MNTSKKTLDELSISDKRLEELAALSDEDMVQWFRSQGRGIRPK